MVVRLIHIPRDPLQRARLAFLALAALALGMAWLQLLILAGESPFRGAAAVFLLALGGSWLYLYRSRRSSWWVDLITGSSLFLFALALPVPDLGLALFYIALYVHTFYGSRLESARSTLLIVAAYLGAEIELGFYESEILAPFVAFQVPSLLVTGAILRVFHESLVSQKELSEELERMIQMEAVTRLTGGIAHDFNNLLTAIGGSLDLALTEMEQKDPARSDVLLARETTSRAAGLTRQLLSFSRNAMVQPEPVRVDPTLESMVPLLDHLLGDSAELHAELGADEASVMIDPPSFEQVLTNLVVNAREAMADQEGPARVTVRTKRIQASDLPPSSPLRDDPPESDGFLELAVADTGPGMKQATRERAFEPFFTTKKTGSGLGLSTVYGIVTQAGGTVDLSTASGRGTTVRIHLPLTQGVAEDAGSAAREAPRKSRKAAAS